jgi:anaerobic selenocysteine-containing dehydrogenase
MTVPVPDIDRTDLLVVVGANPMVSNGSLWTVPGFKERARKLKARGGKLIVVDPKRTATAKEADQYISIRPGTDVFFFLSILATLFEEGLVNPKSARDQVQNLDRLDQAVAPYPPEATQEVTGISSETVRNLTREIAATQRAAFYTRIGTSVSEFGTTATWAADLINILTGHLDVDGGAMWPKTAAFQYNASGPGGTGKGVRSGRRTSRVRGAPEVMGEFPAVCLAEEIETPGEGQIRLLFTIAGNPALSAPGGDRLARALDSLDFMVSTDIYLNETTRHADVILPGASQLEEFHFPISFQQFSARNVVRYTPAVFPLTQGRPAEWEIMYQLALIMSGQDETMSVAALDDMIVAGRVKSAIGSTPELEGRDEADILAELAPRRGPERVIDLELRTGPYGDRFGADPDGITLSKLAASPNGIDLGPLKPRLHEILRTPSGTIDLLPHDIADDLPRVSTRLQELKTSPVPTMVMIGRRNVRTNNSWMHNLPVLAKGKFKGALEIHPKDARQRGLQTGAIAVVSNDNGSVEVEVEVTDDVSPGVVCLPHGFGHVFDDTNLTVAGQAPGANSNLLASTEKIDPLSGTAVLNGIEVQVAAK